MSTHSMIGIKRTDCIEVTYCHYDGFLEGNGEILNKYYQNIQDIENLISKGSIYELGTQIKKTYYMRYLKSSKIKLGRLHHNYYQRVVTPLLGRKTKEFSMIHEIVEYMGNFHDKIDFIYLYHEKLGKWLYLNISSYEKMVIRDLKAQI